ncbi:MAG: hypothetical protein HC922_09805 [Leptolyngbyaceae cyanobacterium SM2_3_12]|nr:hypothetical protein [Leptolyngbyaceae cyanobacterium SM2_3_12]
MLISTLSGLGLESAALALDPAVGQSSTGDAQAQFYWNAIRPEGAGEFSLRLQPMLLFPR